MDSESMIAIAVMSLAIIVLVWMFIKWRKATVIDEIVTASKINKVAEKIQPTFVCTGIMTELIEPGTFELDGNQVNGPLCLGMNLVGPGGSLQVIGITNPDAESMTELSAGSNGYSVTVKDPGAAVSIIKDQLKHHGSIEFAVKK